MNALFIHIPKTAGIWVQDSLPMKHCRFPNRARRFNNKGFVTFGHMDPRRFANKKFLQSAFIFAFCRNPYDRAVSHYCYARRKHPDILSPSTSFVKWTERLGSYRGKFRPQSTWIDKIRVDYIGKYERLYEDIFTIAEYLRVDIRKIPPQNVTRHKPYKQFYCEQSKENIERYYKRDFDRFGYKHDDNLLYEQQA